MVDEEDNVCCDKEIAAKRKAYGDVNTSKNINQPFEYQYITIPKK